MCLRTLVFLLLRGRVPNRLEILVSSQEADEELLQRSRKPGVKVPVSCGRKSLEKKQLPSVVLAALKGLGELRSSNTLARSLSSVMALL